MTTERLTTVTNYHCAMCMMRSRGCSSMLYILKDLCSLLFPATVMVDFETSEHTAIIQVFTDALIRGCLFHFKQDIKRHLTYEIPGYATNGLVRRDF